MEQIHLSNLHPPKKRHLIIPLAMLLLLTLGTVTFYLLQTTRMLDEREITHSTRLAEAAIAAELDNLSNWAYDYGYWNDSVTHLIENLNPIWADDNIGSYLYEAYGITASAVFKPNDQLQISFVEGQQVDASSPLGNLLPQVLPLVQQARKASASESKATHGLIKIGQSTYLAAAQAILPEGEPIPPEQKRGILVLLKKIDQKLLQQISRNYLLPQLKLEQNQRQEGSAHLPLISATGSAIGELQWQLEQPGQRLFHTLAPAIPIPLVLALFLTLLFLQRMRLFFHERQVLYQQLNEEKTRLEESEETLSAIIGAIPSPLFFKNSEGCYLGCNQAFCDYLGLPKDMIVGHRVHDLAPEDLAEVYHHADLDLIRDGGTQTYETQVQYADGGRRDILFNKATIDNQANKTIGLVGIMTDITEVKQVQRESHRLRKRLRNIIDSMPSMLVTVDEKQQVTEWNRWAEVTSHVTAQQALGRPLLEVFPALKEQHIDLTMALSSGRVQTWPRVPWKLDSQEIFVDLTVYPLDKDTGSGAVLRADNTTDRVRMEEVMVLSEKMLSIGSLAAGMAHEINNPLAIILQHAQVLQNRLSPELTKNQSVALDCGIDLEQLAAYLRERGINDMLVAIRQAGDRAKVIVEEMVNFSQRHETCFAPCGLESLIDETLRLAETDYDLKKKFAFGKIKINKQLATAVPELFCDQHDIQQVLLNLLRNSAKALFDSNTESPEISLVLNNNDTEVRLELSDNGPGIEPAIIKRIFDPFFTTSNAGQGTGLGLSVAYFIICEKHGGRLNAENLEHGGCRFLIRLPFASPLEQVKRSA